MTRTALLLLGLGASAAVPAALAALPPAAEWEIGPVIRGRNYSVGMPSQPIPVRGGGWYLNFPYPSAAAGHVHYLGFDPGPIAGARRIVMRFRIEAARGTRFVPQERPAEPATISLFIQQRGDNWSGTGRFASYRWYSPPHTVTELTAGEHTLAVSLDDGWTSVDGRPNRELREGFAAALADTARIGFVLGSPSARGHGVFATGPARMTVLDYRVE